LRFGCWILYPKDELKPSPTCASPEAAIDATGDTSMRKALSAALVATAIAVGSTGTATAQEYPSLNLKLAHLGPASFTGSQVDQWFADEVKKRSGGKIRIRIFWS